MATIVEQNKQRGFVTLDSVVRSYLMDIGAGMERYEQGKHWAVEGYRQFHFDHANEVKTVRLTMTAWKAIELPIDFVDWVLIGVEVDYQIRVMTNDNRISLYHPDEDEIDGLPDDRSLPSNATEDDTRYFFYNLTSRGEDSGQLYGLTANDNGVGYFKMNKERREIQLSPHIDASTPIYLEYISDGYDPCAQTMVNVYAARLIKLFIHWQRHEFSKSSTGMERERAKDMYDKELFKVQSRLCELTAADILEAHRDSYRLISSF
jgi:hypothetical protein